MNVRRRRILYASITALVLSATLLVSVAADWDLTAGDSARVAYTGGDGVILRTQPGGEIIDYLPEGYPLTIQDGYYASDGSYWYSVSVDLAWGWSEGWVLADYVAGDSGVSTFIYEGDAAAARFRRSSTPAEVRSICGQIPGPAQRSSPRSPTEHGSKCWHHPFLMPRASPGRRSVTRE
ncbi:MAG: SH3 domain-containing protein [Thermomicrobiales bacterium]